jgi:hypothetical protein
VTAASAKASPTVKTKCSTATGTISTISHEGRMPEIRRTAGRNTANASRSCVKLNSTEAIGRIARGKYTFRMRPAFPVMAWVEAVRALAKKVQGRRPAMMK